MTTLTSDPSAVIEPQRCADCRNVIGGSGVYDPATNTMLCVECADKRAAHEAEILATVPPIAPRPSRAAVPLPEAVLCVDCDTIYQTGPESECPRCGARSSFAVARVLAPRDSAAPWRRQPIKRRTP